MELIFWLSFALVAFAYVGYALLLAAVSQVRCRPVHAAGITPTVSIVMAAHNEERHLPGKLANLLALDYPPELLEVIVVSDGSTDGTALILHGFGERITPVLLPVAQGKSIALNHGVARARGEVLFFCDVRQRISPDALRHLVKAFADPAVGAVSGELHLESSPGVPDADGLGIYWKIEKLVRSLESRTGSVVGVTGAIYALRRDAYRDLPAGTLLDDVLIPMNAARLGFRVLFEPAAKAWDSLFTDPGKEFRRKVRTLTGNYQLLRLAPWLLSPGNPLLFRFVSHKLLRLWVPFFLPAMLLSSALAGTRSTAICCILQVLFYVLALLGRVWPRLRALRPVAIAYTFVVLNWAALLACRNAVTGRDEVWTR